MALTSNGVSLRDVAVYAAYWVLVIVLPGLIVWDFVWSRIEPIMPISGDQTRLELFVCGAVAGYALELPAYALARWADAPRVFIALPILVVGAWLVTKRPWQDRVDRRPGDWQLVPALGLSGVLTYTAVWLGVRAMPLAPLAPDGRFADLDDPFQLALIGELRHHFPAVYPYAIEEPLNYQFFYHLHAAASTWITGLPPLEVFARFDPLLFAMLSVAGVACVTQRVVGRPWAGVLAAGTLSLLGAFDITGIYRGQATFEDRFLTSLLIHSPTQAMSFALVTPLVLIALAAMESGRVSATGFVTFVLLSFMITGAKVTFAPMVFAGLAGAWLLGWLRGRRAFGPLALAGAALAGMAACVSLLFGTGGRGLTLSPLSVAEWYGGGYALVPGSWSTDALIVLLVVTSVLVPVAGMLGLGRESLADSRVHFLFLSGVAGIGATAVFGHGGLSQRYFLYSSAWFLAVVSAWGISDLFARVSSKRLVLYAMVALAAGVAVLGIRILAERHSEIAVSASGETFVRPGFPGWLGLPLIAVLGMLFLAIGRIFGDGTRSRRLFVTLLVGMCLARPLALVVGDVEHLTKPPASASPTVTTILHWLRTQTDPDDVVMTNAHCLEEPPTDPPRCDNRHFWMSALAERRFLLEGWGYVERLAEDFFAPYGGDPALLADNDRQFAQPTKAGLRQFADHHGVDWLLVDRSRGGDLHRLEEAGARSVLEFDDYALFAAPTS